jgi:hypothetical protein
LYVHDEFFLHQPGYKITVEICELNDLDVLFGNRLFGVFEEIEYFDEPDVKISDLFF